MCIKKVLYCPDCHKFRRLLDNKIPTPPGVTKMIYYEHPCGRSICDYFKPLNVHRGEALPEITGDEVGKPCPSGGCSLQSCRVEREIVSCCNETAGFMQYRSRSSWLL